VDVDPTEPLQHSRALPEDPFYAKVLAASIDLLILRTGVLWVPHAVTLHTLACPKNFGAWRVDGVRMPYLIWTEGVILTVEARLAGRPSRFECITKTCVTHQAPADHVGHAGHARHGERCYINTIQRCTQRIVSAIIAM
jgi:hypothetical protein